VRDLTPGDPAEHDPERHAERHPDRGQQAGLGDHDEPGLPPGHAERLHHGQFVPAAPHRGRQRVADRAERQQDQEGAQRERQHRHVPHLQDRLRQGRRGEANRHAGRDPGQRGQPPRGGGRGHAGPERDLQAAELVGVQRSREQPVITRDRHPGAGVVLVVRPPRHESDPGDWDPVRPAAAAQGDHRPDAGVRLARRCRREGDLARRARQPAGREHHRHRLAADWRVRIGRDRDLAVLGDRAGGVVQPGHQRARGERGELAAKLRRRHEIVAVLADPALELVGLAEPGRVGGRVRDAGRERERGQHAEHAGDRAGQGGPDRQGGPAPARLEREPGADQHRHRGTAGGRGTGDDGPPRSPVSPAGGDRTVGGGERAGQHQRHREHPAGAQDHPVGADPGGGLEQRGRADGHPARRRDGGRDPERGPGRGGRGRAGARGYDRLARRDPGRAQYLQVGDRRRDIPDSGLADQEQRRRQRGQPEREQASRLVVDGPLGRGAEGDLVVPDVDVGRPTSWPGPFGTAGWPPRRLSA